VTFFNVKAHWQNHPWWNRINFEDVRRGVKEAPHRAHCEAKVQDLLSRKEANSASSTFPDDPASSESDFSCFDGFTLMDRYFTSGANVPASFSGVVWRKSFVKKKKKA